jgi:hypothetical protein
MKVLQYIPAFIEISAPFAGEVQSLAELTGLDFVARFWREPGFYQFSKTPAAEGDDYLLMAEFEEGARWYVVARLSGADVEVRTGVLPLWGT